MRILKTDVIKAAGATQVCAGHEPGAQAAIHIMIRLWESELTDGILLVNAQNAFNRLNRQVALHNIQFISLLSASSSSIAIERLLVYLCLEGRSSHHAKEPRKDAH